MKNLFRAKNILMFLSFMLFGAFVAMAVGSFAGFIPASGMMLGAVIPFQSLEHDENTCNMAGISTVVYVTRTSDIISWPELAANQVLPENLVDLIGDFTLKPGAFFYSFYSTQELGEFNSAVEGPRDGEYFKISGNFFYPNTSKRALGLSVMFKNADVVIIVKEFSGNGQMRVIGSKDLPARIKPSEASGKAFSDQKGITFNIEASSCKVPLVYNGTVLTEAGADNTVVSIAYDDTIMDGSNGNRFASEDHTSAAPVSSYPNFSAGRTARIEHISDLNPRTYVFAYGAEITLSHIGDYVDIVFIEDGLPTIVNAYVA